MNKLFLILAFALLSHEALGFRLKRQSEDNEEDVEDRYGWSRPNRFPNQGQSQWQNFPSQGVWGWPNQRPSQFPGQQFPGQQLPGQFPGQNQGQGQFPGQNQGQGQFPGQNQGQNPGQNQGQGQNPGQNPNPTTQAPGGSTTQSAALQDCIRTCLVTPEYNPVCGSDNQTYDNPGRLLCAQSCGVSVTQVRATRCPNATIPPVA